jgi:hypothetical protein
MSEEKKEDVKKEVPTTEKTTDMPKKSGMKGVVIGLVAVIVLAGVAVGLTQWNSGSSMTTEERTAAMAKKVGELESVKYTAMVEAELGVDGQEEITEVLKEFGVEGDVASIVLAAEGESSMKEENQNASLDLSLRAENGAGEEQISVGVNARMISDLIYVQLQKLPEEVSGLLTEEAGLDLSFLEEQWIEVNIEEVVEQLGLPAEELELLEDTELTEEEREMVATAFVDHTFIQLTGEGEEEKVEAGNALKYEANLNVSEMRAFFEEVKPVFTAREVSDEDYNELLDSLNEEEYNEMLEDVNLETHVWIGKKDNELYKIEMLISSTDETDIDELKSLTLSLELTNHNKAVTIDTPEDVMSLQEVIGQLVFAAGAAGNTADEPAQDVVDAPVE